MHGRLWRSELPGEQVAYTFAGALIFRLRLDQAFLNVALPGLEISDPALGLLARQMQQARDVIYPHGAIFLLVVGVSGRFYIYSVSALPLFFGLRRRL